MLKKYTRADINAAIKLLDKRCITLTDEQLDAIINEGYAELTQFAQPFANEEVVSMAPYYDLGEAKITLDIEEDCLYVYDLYATIETNTPLTKVRNSDGIVQDSRYVGRVHVDLDLIPTVDNVVIKYTYVPDATADDIFVDKPTYNCMMQAFRVAIDVNFKDEKREVSNRVNLEQKCLMLLPNYMFDMMSV